MLSEVELDKIADPALALLVDEVLALEEGRVLVGGHGDGLCMAEVSACSLTALLCSWSCAGSMRVCWDPCSLILVTFCFWRMMI